MEEVKSPTEGTLPEKTIIRRFVPPTLERKDSSGDLQSRLKTRKILGVGETDNGDIHRSKISQVLGHNEHLYMRMPRGYWQWQTFLVLVLTGESLLIFILPERAESLGNLPKGGDRRIARYYAGALLAFSFLFWKFLYYKDKTVTRAVQFGAGLFFATHIGTDFVSVLEDGPSTLFQPMVLLNTLIRIGLCGGCYVFWRRIGAATSGLRRSPSHKDEDGAPK